MISAQRARKSNSHCYRNSWTNNNFRESNQEKKQRPYNKMKQRRFRAITLQGIIEKSSILR